MRSPDSGEEPERRRVPRGAPEHFFFGARRFAEAHTELGRLNKGFFGDEHITALVSLLRDGDIAQLVEACMENLEDEVWQTLSP